MEWQVILAIVLAVPVILIPVALIWYINAGGISIAIKELRQRKTTRKPVDEKATIL